MKNCNSCGFNNDSSMRFCVECGAVLSSKPKMVVPLVPGEVKRTEDHEQQTVVSPRSSGKKSSFLKYFVIALVGAGLLLVVSAAGIGVAIALSIYNAPAKRPLVQQRDYPKTTPTPFVTRTPHSNPTPQATPTRYVEPPVDPIGPASKRGSFTIAADRSWQISRIRTVGGQRFQVTATGSYGLSGINRRVRARGINGYIERRIFKQYRTGALLMRTHFPDGTHSNIQPVASGRYWENYPKERGLLEFIINDNALEDNSGTLRIRFKSTG